jgi:putative transposase
MAQSLAKNLVHLVFSTKNRERLIYDDLRCDLHAYMATVLKNMECPALIINSVEDHVHILFILHRTVALSSAVGELKSASSKWLKTQSDQLATFAWQAGFGAFSVSESNVDAVRQYIEKQKEHHRKVSFQDEFRSFLSKHQVEYDERYLWD